jgi:hypothetical protein
MKKVLIIAFICTVAFNVGAVIRAVVDETPPAGLKAVSNTMYIGTENSIWMDKGPFGGWNRMARYSDIVGGAGSATAVANGVHKNDANGNLNWANKIITSNGNQIDKDSDTGTWYWNHVVSGSASSEPVTVVMDANGNTTVTSNGGAIL